MKFKNLHIYGRERGKEINGRSVQDSEGNRVTVTTFSGSLEIEEKSGSITLNLSDEQIRRIINVCAESIVGIAEETAQDMRTQVLESMKDLQHKETE